MDVGDHGLEARLDEVARLTFIHIDLRAPVTHTRVSQACIRVHGGRVTKLSARLKDAR